MNTEKETKLTTRKALFIMAMDINFCKLCEVKHYDEH